MHELVQPCFLIYIVCSLSKTKIWSLRFIAMLAHFLWPLTANHIDGAWADKVIEQGLKMVKDIPTRRSTEGKSTRVC